MGSQMQFTMKERKEIAMRFRQFRKRHLLTQKELAALMGVTAATVSNAELLKSPVGAATMRAFKVTGEQMDLAQKRRLRRVPA